MGETEKREQASPDLGTLPSIHHEAALFGSYHGQSAYFPGCERFFSCCSRLTAASATVADSRRHIIAMPLGASGNLLSQSLQFLGFLVYWTWSHETSGFSWHRRRPLSALGRRRPILTIRLSIGTSTSF